VMHANDAEGTASGCTLIGRSRSWVASQVASADFHSGERASSRTKQNSTRWNESKL
jgi:hypothetical protein